MSIFAAGMLALLLFKCSNSETLAVIETVELEEVK
jgi:hypothetical protein